MKTGTPGTYRPITLDAFGRTTCPRECPYTADCYAQQSFVGWHQSRASSEALPSLASAAIAMVLAKRIGTLARLHISGDFGKTSRLIDNEYIEGLLWLARKLRERWPAAAVAYTYTHFPVEKFIQADGRNLLQEMEEVGISVRVSDKWGHNGAVVAPHSRIPEWRKSTGLDLVLCPAQLTHNAVQCADCRLCWERPAKVIVFEPHGSMKNSISRKAEKVRVREIGK